MTEIDDVPHWYAFPTEDRSTTHWTILCDAHKAERPGGMDMGACYDVDCVECKPLAQADDDERAEMEEMEAIFTRRGSRA